MAKISYEAGQKSKQLFDCVEEECINEKEDNEDGRLQKDLLAE